MFTSEMVHLTAIVAEKSTGKVSHELLRQGVLDFVKVSKLDIGVDPRISAVTSKFSTARLQESRIRIETLTSSLPKSPLLAVDLKIEDFKTVDLDVVETQLDEISSEVQDLRNIQRDLQREILQLEDLDRQIALFGDLRGTVKRQSSYSFLQIRAGTISVTMLDDFSRDLLRFPSVQLNFSEGVGRITLMIITLKRDEQAVSAILDKYSWVETDLPENSGPTKDLAATDIKAKITRLKSKQEQYNTESTRNLGGKADWFRDTWVTLTMYSLIDTIQSYFSKTQRTVIFSGWLPAGKRDSLEKGIRKVVDNKCVLQWTGASDVTAHSGESIEIPVQLNNPKSLAPFEMLVTNYAIPEYGTINPTPFVAVAYLAMFGLMFSDVGHGIVLLLLGILAKLYLKKVKDGMRQIFSLMTYCGVSAMIFGVLFGSYFGREWLPPLWFNYHGIISGHGSGNSTVSNIYDILLITIYFGILVIGVGLVLNWINLFRKKRYMKLVFDKSGLLGGFMYGMGVYTGFYFANHAFKTLPGGLFLLIAFGVPAFLLLGKEPIHYLLRRKHNENRKPFSFIKLMNGFMEWLVEILEIFSGYLANTLSFMRVAGLGIAHVSLMIAFTRMAEMAASQNGTYTVWSFLILILGNALVIALEGLSAGIQSLRLNYYEFFSKYFIGSGKAYAPISLKVRTQEEEFHG